MTKSSKAPSTNLSGLKKHWGVDFISAISVALVALPLGLGVAIASGVPPMAGLWSAIIAGLFTTFFRGTTVGINGPAAGLIIVTASAMQTYEHTGKAFSIVLGAFCMAGVVMFLIGLFRAGRLGDMLPVSVINGLMAAIGVIIVVKQLDEALGVVAREGSALDIIWQIPESLLELNPYVTLITVVSILILAFHKRISNKFIHFVPAPMWVLLFTIPFVYIFNFFQLHDCNIFGRIFELGPHLLINIPDNVRESIVHPDFSQIHTPTFWVIVLSVTLVSSIEGLLSAKAVERLDPYRRRSNLNKDMMGSGLSTIIAGCIGGLPIITVILRSSLNVNHGAKTGWSNFFHGVLILLFVLVLTPIIQTIPLAALAGILIFTGYKLASPKVFKDAWLRGYEQLLFAVVTLIATLAYGLILGLAIGVAVAIVVHLLSSRFSWKTFLRYVLKPSMEVSRREDGVHLIKMKGVANFLGILKLSAILDKIDVKDHLVIDCANARLVDYTILEYLHDYVDAKRVAGAKVDLIGLDNHRVSSNHPSALHVLIPNRKPRFTLRQKELLQLAKENGWSYQRELDWDGSYLRNFRYFNSRPIEYKNNIISGEYKKLNVNWEISDITFDEGAGAATEVYHTTVQVVRLPVNIPVFTLDKEELFDRVLDLAEHEDIDWPEHKNFSTKFVLKAPDRLKVRSFFTDEIIAFFEGEEIYHVESNGNALLVFKMVRAASASEVQKMVRFCKTLTEKLRLSYNEREAETTSE